MNASVNVVLSKDFNSTMGKLGEMMKELQRISAKLAQLKTGQTTRGQSRQQQRLGTGPICWNCNEHGHIQRACPQSRCRGHGQSARSCRRMRENRLTTAANCNSMPVIDGYVGDHLTRMLIDTGSDVSILREDVWKMIHNDSSH